MKTLFYFLILLFLCSCNSWDLQPRNNFRLFDNETLVFDYYFDFGQSTDPSSNYTMAIRLQDGVEVEGGVYHAFFDQNSNPVPNFILGEDNQLIYNLLPIRYEDGNYFEYRGQTLTDERKEVLILKNNIQKGDSWEQRFERTDFEFIYSFEVVEFFETYNGFGIEYDNVYKIKESVFPSPLGAFDPYISYHYYNRDMGIVRREIPIYVSGAFSPVTFNRID
ncbi:MAG: hypothetical protein AAF587_05540 [Bacteroidota bacterium]